MAVSPNLMPAKFSRYTVARIAGEGFRVRTMCANAFTMRSADTCIFRDPYMKKRLVCLFVYICMCLFISFRPTQFVVCEGQKFSELSTLPSSCFHVVNAGLQLEGYRVAVVTEWALNRARLVGGIRVNYMFVAAYSQRCTARVQYNERRVMQC